MYRSLLPLLVVFGLTFAPALGDEPPATVPEPSCDNSSTLKLYFAPDVANVQRGETGFKPEVARIFVDEHYVGNAILNVHSHLPTLKLAAGPYTIRVELNNRRFQSKLSLLGRGSTQILFVDFDNPATVAQTK